jgi:hypothetical protein
MPMMTLERAAEMVAKMRTVSNYAAQDLFCHFDDVFGLSKRKDDGKAIKDFAVLCGYDIATNVKRV